mgnify:CR=1 FL=1
MDTNKIHERYDNTLKTGEWWTNPWWQEDCYYNDRLFTREEAEAAFIQLKEIFDAKWVIEQRDTVIAKAREWLKKHEQEVIRNSSLLDFKEKLDNSSTPSEAYKVCILNGFRAVHSLFDNFLSVKGLLLFQYLVNLGLNLLAVKKANLLEADLIIRLKNSNEYLGAHFELDIPSYLIRNGFSVERPRSNGTSKRKADFKVSKESETLFVELKKLQPSCENKLISDITYQISENLFYDPLINSTQDNICFKLSRDLVIKTKTSKGRKYVADNWLLIAEQIKHHITERIQRKNYGHHTVPGLGEYDLFPKEGIEVGVRSFEGFPLLENSEVKKIYHNAIKDALEQLPPEGPGVLLVSTFIPLNFNVFQQIVLSKIEKDTKKYQYLSAIALVYEFFAENKIQYQFEILQNHYAVTDVSSYAILKAMLSLGNS